MYAAVENTGSNQELAAYWAGLFDGEGHVRISATKGRVASGKKYYSLQVTIVNTCRDPLEEIHSHFDGSFRVRKTTATWRACYTLTLQGARAQEFLKFIQPYSRIKRQEIKVALEFFTKHGHPGLRGSQVKITPDEFLSMKNYKETLEGIRSGRFQEQGIVRLAGG